MNILEALKQSKDGKITILNYVSKESYFDSRVTKWYIAIKPEHKDLTLYELIRDDWTPYSEEDIEEYKIRTACEIKNKLQELAKFNGVLMEQIGNISISSAEYQKLEDLRQCVMTRRETLFWVIGKHNIL